jgi:hypothetical protein
MFYSLRQCLNKVKHKNFSVMLFFALSHGWCWSCTHLCSWGTVWFPLFCCHIHVGTMCTHLFTILVILCSSLGQFTHHLWRNCWSYGSQKELTKSELIWHHDPGGMTIMCMRKYSVFTFITVPGYIEDTVSLSMQECCLQSRTCCLCDCCCILKLSMAWISDFKL